jgi:hypothetical protein
MTNEKPFDDWRVLMRGETRHVDFKAALAWDDDGKQKLLKHVIAMSNIRDGGRIVIGVRENEQTKAHEAEGLSPEQLSSFDATKIAQFVNSYVQPGVRVRVERAEVEGKQVIVLEVAEFDQLPNVCVKPGPRGGFNSGDVLIRTDGCESRRICSSEEMRALLTLAVGKTSDTLLRDVRQVLEGTTSKATSVDPTREERHREWDEALAGFKGELAAKEGVPVPVLECIIEPLGPVAGLGSHDALRTKLRQSTVALPYLPAFPNSQYAEISNRVASIEGKEDVETFESLWRLYDSGLLLYAHRLRGFGLGELKPGKYLGFNATCADVMTAFLFAGRFAQAIEFDGEVDLRFVWTEMADRKLVFPLHQIWSPEGYPSREQRIEQRARVRAVDLRTGWEPVAADLLARVFALFQASPDVRDGLKAKFDAIRKGQW